MISKFCPSIFAASALVLGVTVLLPANDAAAQGARSKGWYKLCSEQNETKICNTQYQAHAGTGQVVTSVNLAEITGKVKRRVFQITVPTGRLIPPGIILQIDDAKKGAKIPYVYCAPRSCAAEVKLDDNLVKLLKNGSVMTITSTNVQNKPNPIKITLKGFTAAYDGAPLKQDELQSKQKQLEEELNKKAKDISKKLQAAQDAAKKSN
ncbi:MAG: invasion associated locus B family protein [Rhizobiaceae bacterium]|nr:invasion associated locus B family protein [Rhizobiaceae bacterium]